MKKELLRPAWIEVNLDNLEHNLREICMAIGPDRSIIGIVKADAYGHGAVECSKVMLRNGASHLAVATLCEALELRKNGIRAPIMLLGIVPAIYADIVVKNDIIPILSDYQNAKSFSDEAVKQKKTVRFMIAVETGMGRIGFPSTEEGADSVLQISLLTNSRIECVMSHFSSADMESLDYSLGQLQRFQAFLDMLEARHVSVPIRSLSNSPAMFRLPESYYDAVRPGAMLWGFYPPNINNPEKFALLPVMTVKADIVYLKTVPAGTSISYGRKFVTTRESRIATLPLGYADGMTRLLQGNQVRALVHGCSVPVLGTICMDQCMLDVTDVPNVEIGDEAVLLGRQDGNEIPITELCDITTLCCGELFYNFSKRLPRMYFYHGEEILPEVDNL